MAGSPFSAKLFSSFISTTMTRRGFAAAAAQGVVVSSGARSGSAMAKTKRTGEEMAKKSENVAWVPDPVTGCYRPDNQVPDIDAAELRAVLLNQKN